VLLLSKLLFSSVLWASSSGLSLLDDGTHCVAYKAEKTTLLFTSGEVIGKNCDISAQVLPEVGGLYHIEVIIPIRGFQSGSADRDEDVAKTLKAADKPELTFRSKAMSPDQWRELFGKGKFDIEGELQIGAKAFPVKLASQYIHGNEGDEIDGRANVKFADFELSPPKVVGGLVAKSKPDLELHFHLLGSRILGADSIRLEKK